MYRRKAGDIDLVPHPSGGFSWLMRDGVVIGYIASVAWWNHGAGKSWRQWVWNVGGRGSQEVYHGFEECRAAVEREFC